MKILYAAVASLLLVACVPPAKTLEPYNGPQATLAVAHFACENNCGPRKQTGLEYGNRSLPALTITLAEDLAERLKNSQRFRIVEPAALGFVRGYSSNLETQGSDLLLLATILEANTDKNKQGNSNVLAGIGINAETQTASFKLRLEVYDQATSSIVYTTDVETNSASLGTTFSARQTDESLDVYSGTALPDAIEQAMQQALYNIATALPAEYFRY